MADLQVDVRSDRVESAIVYAPFDQSLQTLMANSYDIISTAQNAQLRIEQGANSPVSQNGNWVKEGVIYIPNSNPRLVRVSPILAQAKDATQAHRNGKEFYLTSNVERLLTDSVTFPQKNIEIPTNRFGDEELTRFVFGGEREAQQYGEFLKETGVKSMPVWAVDSEWVNAKSQPFVRQLWFGGLGDGGSDLYGDYYYLDGGDGIRGVRSVVSTEGANASQISTSQGSELYTPRQISKALHEIGIIGSLEARIYEELRRK